MHLTDAALLAGDPKAGLDYSKTAVRESRACRARNYLAYALLPQIEAALAIGDVETAAAAAGEALALAADSTITMFIEPRLAAKDCQWTQFEAQTGRPDVAIEARSR